MELVEKGKCTGCWACFNACEFNCIEMIGDNEGFCYPVIDKNKCIECGRCRRACPILNRENLRLYKVQNAYIVQNKNFDVLFQSSSGGFFSAVAEWVIKQGGIVYGAVFDEDFRVKHVGVRKMEDLGELRKSKYIQSNIGMLYRNIKKELDAGMLVCFCGTPCQVSGLSSYLQDKYTNLILMDFVCHGVGSPLIWDKYLIKRNKKDIGHIYFRDKSKGYHYSKIKIVYKDKTHYCSGTEADQYLRSYFSNICLRTSCYNCSFKGSERVSDFTMWDCFDLDSRQIDDSYGASKVVLRTSNAEKIFTLILDNLLYEQCDISSLVESSFEMNKSVCLNPKRELFFTLAKETENGDVFDKYFPIGIKSIARTSVRELLYQLGIYSGVRKKYNKLKKIIKGKS